MSQTHDALPNLVVRLRSFEADGTAKVELMTPIGDLPIGDVLLAHVKKVSMGVQPGDFSVLKKYGLRPGGIVSLRKAEMVENTIEAKSIDTIIANDRGSFPTILNDAAVCILAPKPGTMVVDKAYVAIGLEKSATFDPVKTLQGSLKADLERACQFGAGGVIITGEDSDGEVIESMIGGDQVRSADEVIALFEEEVPSEVLDAMDDDPTKAWHIVPFFAIEIDPDRSSKLSAQRLNIEYGDGDEISWTRSQVVLRVLYNSWALADASSGKDVVKQTAGLLLDVIDE